MQATIRINGNKLEGYTLTLTMPRAFLSQFVQVNPPLFGLNVDNFWGYAIDKHQDDSDREIICIYEGLEEAKGEAEKIVKEIKYLNDLIDNQETVDVFREIPLSTLH